MYYLFLYYSMCVADIDRSPDVIISFKKMAFRAFILQNTTTVVSVVFRILSALEF